MKNYSLKTKESSLRKHRTRELYKKLGVVGVALLVLFFGRSAVGGLASAFFGPIHSIRHYIQTSSDTIPVYLRDRGALLAEIQSLEQQVVSQQGLRNILTALEEDNRALRALSDSTEVPRVSAGIIARPPYSPYDTIIIDKGAEQGIVSSAPVYYGSGYALGYVRSVYARHALVTLFSSPNVETSVYIYGPDIFTTAYGEGGGIIRLSVPQGVHVTEGDVVALPSLDRGILGTVSSVVSVSTEPEQRAYVRLEVPLQSLRVVAVSAEPHAPVSFDDARKSVAELEDELFSVEIPPDFTGTSTVPEPAQATSTP